VFIVEDPVTPSNSRYYWTNSKRVWKSGCRHFMAQGFSVFSFVPFSSRAAWDQLCPEYIPEEQPMIVQTGDAKSQTLTTTNVSEVSRSPPRPRNPDDERRVRFEAA
jgi:hypothetical protein